MFRTARGWLLLAPAAFLVALGAFLVAHPGAADDYTVYPFLVDAVGRDVARRPILRFVLSSGVFFLIPYLVVGVLLFLADLGLAAARRLWKRGGLRADEPLPPEARIGFVGTSLVAAGVAGVLLHRVAHGGDLPGGVNVAPVMVAGVPFAAAIAGLLAAGLFVVPRAVAARVNARGAPP